MGNTSGRVRKARTKGPFPAAKHTSNPLSLSKVSGYYELDRPEVIAFVKQQTIRAQKVIELGCSSGLIGSKLKEALGDAHYTGIELSEDVAQKAHDRLDEVHVA